MAIHLKTGTLYWYARAFIHHETREQVAVDNGELAYRLVIALIVEGHGVSILSRLKLDVAFNHRRYVILYACQSIVRQSVDDEMSAFVSHSTLLHRAVAVALFCVNGFHFDVAQPRTVVEAHIALHASSVLAGTCLYLSL